MTISAKYGPLTISGPRAPSAIGDYTDGGGPSLFANGIGLMDPRYDAVRNWSFGADTSLAAVGWAQLAYVEVNNAVPSTISASNIAGSQVPVASTAVTLTAGTGLTGGVSITRADTGAVVTGLLEIDQGANQANTPPNTIAYGNGPQNCIYDPAGLLARNVRITSAGDDSGGTFVVRGFDIYQYPMTETITGANATVASGKKAFKYILSVTPLGTVSGSNITIGVGDVYGFPLRSTLWEFVLIYFNGALLTSSTGWTVADATSPATATTGDVRGTYALQSASNATKRLTIMVAPRASGLSTANLLGVTQFADF